MGRGVGGSAQREDKQESSHRRPCSRGWGWGLRKLQGNRIWKGSLKSCTITTASIFGEILWNGRLKKAWKGERTAGYCAPHFEGVQQNRPWWNENIGNAAISETAMPTISCPFLDPVCGRLDRVHKGTLNGRPSFCQLEDVAVLSHRHGTMLKVDLLSEFGVKMGLRISQLKTQGHAS